MNNIPNNTKQLNEERRKTEYTLVMLDIRHDIDW